MPRLLRKLLLNELLRGVDARRPPPGSLVYPRLEGNQWVKQHRPVEGSILGSSPPNYSKKAVSSPSTKAHHGAFKVSLPSKKTSLAAISGIRAEIAFKNQAMKIKQSLATYPFRRRPDS